LLPNLGAAHEHKLFFVLAYTQGRGAEIIGRRMLEQLRRHEKLRAKDYAFAVSYSYPTGVAEVAGEGQEEHLARVAEEIRKHIFQISLEGKYSDESKENLSCR
jgi:hypothetical protein